MVQAGLIVVFMSIASSAETTMRREIYVQLRHDFGSGGGAAGGLAEAARHAMLSLVWCAWAGPRAQCD